MNEAGDVAPEVERRVQLYRCPGLARVRPGEKRQAQIDRCRVQGIGRVGQIHTKAVLDIELPRRANQAHGQVVVNAPVARLVGVGQSAAGNPASDAQVVGLGFLCSQAGLDVPQAFAVSQLGECLTQELVQVRERQWRVSPSIPANTSPKGVQGQVIHALGEDKLASVHVRAPAM